VIWAEALNTTVPERTLTTCSITETLLPIGVTKPVT